MNKKNTNNFHVRLPDDLYSFLRRQAYERDTSMNSIILELINQYKKKYDNLLTSDNKNGTIVP